MILVYILILLSFLSLYFATLFFWANSMWRNQWDLAFGIISVAFSFFFVFILVIALSILILKYRAVKNLGSFQNLKRKPAKAIGPKL
jgi:uncharacterized BrkB/YihY/UPF0761 family membrane protein